MSRLLRSFFMSKAEPVADRAGVIRDQISHVEAVRRSYQRALDGEQPTRLPEKTLRENIDRTTRRLAELRAELATLPPSPAP